MVAKPLEGVASSGREQASMPRLLDDVTQAAERVRTLELEQRATMDKAREELRVKVRAAHDEGISFAAIGRAAGLSRERVRQLYAGR
jgi:DNA-directed RNA polymerase sigma subunit (sigma70/sigma32)